jgi:NTP pyrophosphatase (non-canonical NTP hydrolase)
LLPQIYIGEKNNKIGGFIMNYQASQQEVDRWIQQFKITYFKPHEIVGQLLEESGELSKEVLHNNQEGIAEELADVVFALICMSNSHNITLQKSYTITNQPQPTILELHYALGQIAREISHLYGPKKKKD